LTDGQRRRLAPSVAAALSMGWAPAALAQFVGANTAGVRSPAAVLAARLSSAELPAPPRGAMVRPPWCGACDERTRMLGCYDGDVPSRCPRCHPLTSGGASGAYGAVAVGPVVAPGGSVLQTAISATSCGGGPAASAKRSAASGARPAVAVTGGIVLMRCAAAIRLPASGC
jgi:hypothetical protein